VPVCVWLPVPVWEYEGVAVCVEEGVPVLVDVCVEVGVLLTW